MNERPRMIVSPRLVEEFTVRVLRNPMVFMRCLLNMLYANPYGLRLCLSMKYLCIMYSSGCPYETSDLRIRVPGGSQRQALNKAIDRRRGCWRKSRVGFFRLVLEESYSIIGLQGGDNENPLSCFPCGIGNRLCIASLCPTNTQAWPQLRRQVVALAEKVGDAFNDSNPTALGPLCTEDGALVTDTDK
jgi:hypothetical protein